MHLENARMPGTSGRSAVPRKPYEGRRQLCNIVEVRFEHILQTHAFDCGELLVRPKDQLVVQTPKGPQLAQAVSLPERRLVERELVHRVIRRANQRDIDTAKQLTLEGRNAMRFALSRVRAQRLPMKLVVVEYMLDRSRALVYFTSESRVDFRNLVRELATELRVRIEMRQIGVRDGTGVIGGIGPCGHELCCSAFLRDFQTVSIREPKDQGITLNPQRITGMCGRLKCCLLYEKQSYSAVRPFTPRQDRSVLTAQGPGSIVEIDALSRKIQVRFPGGTIESIHMRDLIVLDVRLSYAELQATMTREEEVLARRRQKTAGGRVAGLSFDSGDDGYLWDDVEQSVSFFDTPPEAEPELEQGKGRRDADAKRSRRRKRPGKTSAEDAQPAAKETKKSGKDSQRRISKRKRKPATDSQRSANAPTTGSAAATEASSSKKASPVEGTSKTTTPRAGEDSSSSTRRRRRRRSAKSAEAKSSTTSPKAKTDAQSAAKDKKDTNPRPARRRRVRRPETKHRTDKGSSGSED